MSLDSLGCPGNAKIMLIRAMVVKLDVKGVLEKEGNIRGHNNVVVPPIPHKVINMLAVHHISLVVHKHLEEKADVVDLGNVGVKGVGGHCVFVLLALCFLDYKTLFIFLPNKRNIKRRRLNNGN